MGRAKRLGTSSRALFVQQALALKRFDDCKSIELFEDYIIDQSVGKLVLQGWIGFEVRLFPHCKSIKGDFPG